MPAFRCISAFCRICFSSSITSNCFVLQRKGNEDVTEVPEAHS
jgi:hypothetical protein